MVEMRFESNNMSIFHIQIVSVWSLKYKLQTKMPEENKC